MAFDYFVEQLASLHTTDGLVRAAIGVSMHALEDVNPAHVTGRLDSLAQTVLGRVRAPNPSALLAHLHDVLFVEEGFTGNRENYYLAINSYLPVVLKTKRGLPIVLCLVYRAVAERVGLTVEGVNAPGHFLCRVKTDEGWMIVDPFFSGQTLSRPETFSRLELALGQSLPDDNLYLATATNVDWLRRIIGNLQNLFRAEQHADDLAAMNEMQSALTTAVSNLNRNLGPQKRA